MDPFKLQFQAVKRPVPGDGNCFFHCILDFLQMSLKNSPDADTKLFVSVVLGSDLREGPLNFADGVQRLRANSVHVASFWTDVAQGVEVYIADEKARVKALLANGIKNDATAVERLYKDMAAEPDTDAILKKISEDGADAWATSIEVRMMNGVFDVARDCLCDKARLDSFFAKRERDNTVAARADFKGADLAKFDNFSYRIVPFVGGHFLSTLRLDEHEEARGEDFKVMLLTDPEDAHFEWYAFRYTRDTNIDGKVVKNTADFAAIPRKSLLAILTTNYSG